MIFQSLVMILPRFIDFVRKTIRKSMGKNLKNPRPSFVARNMMNKCDKFHGHIPSG